MVLYVSIVDMAYKVTWEEYPLHPFFRVILPLFCDFKVVVPRAQHSKRFHLRGDEQPFIAHVQWYPHSST
jgi:hypothetical protein